jgi:hypothetical protein
MRGDSKTSINFYLVGQHAPRRQAHDDMLGQLLGVVGGGPAAQDEAIGPSDDLQVTDAVAQFVLDAAGNQRTINQRTIIGRWGIGRWGLGNIVMLHDAPIPPRLFRMCRLLKQPTCRKSPKADGACERLQILGCRADGKAIEG